MVEPRVFELGLPPLALEAGGVVDPHHARIWHWGPRPWSGPDGSPVALLVHALTGDCRAGGAGGWWAPLIGPGRPLDPSETHLFCVGNLGAVGGSSAPGQPGFPRRADQPGLDPLPGKGSFTLPPDLPATITPWDQARAQLMVLDALGGPPVDLACGGSLGATIVLCLAALDPPRFARIAPLAGSQAASPWIIALNHTARQVILADPGWPAAPQRGLALARQLAMISYRAEAGMVQRAGRAQRRGGWSGHDAYQIQTWLEHQGAKLVARYDAQAYLCQLGAMDHHDLRRAPPGLSGDPLDRITASCLAVGIDTDGLYLPEHSRALVEALRARGRTAELAMISSAFGHDAFLIEWAQLALILARALALPPGPAQG